ncbi:MAG: ABC transporter substrate-binding protein [Oscillospiraceae bacterium]|nr:ABC transporter substrate-binding protein [Oscillospiraceae bacterium]
MKKLFTTLLSAALFLTMAVGCSTGNSSSGTQSSGSDSQTNSQSDSKNDNTSKTLNLAISTGDGSSTDDKVPTPWYNRTMATNLMFRSLFTSDSSLTEVSEDLASGYTVSEDGLVYTITLKENLKWSDGEALDLDDVVYSIQTAQKAARINSIYTAAFANISEMKAEGNVLTLTLSTPYSTMPQVLAQFAVLPEHKLSSVDPLKLDSDPFWVNPVTSGMYTVDTFNTGNYFTLRINENYEGEKPKIESVTTYFVTDFLTAAMAGNTDFLYGNASDLVEQLSSDSNFTAHEVDVLFYKYFIFNMKGVDGTENEAMQNVEVRKSIIEAIDRASLADLYPNAKVLNSGVPNDNEAYNGFDYKFDADKAKADIAASGYDLSRPLRICYYNNDQTSIDLINTVVYYLEQAGLKVEATLSNDGTTDLFTTRNYDIGFKGKSSFSINEWYTEYMSTDALFANIFGGDTAFDSLIADLSASTDKADTNRILGELQGIEQENAYKVPVFTVGTYVFTNNKLSIPESVEFCNPLYNCDVDYEKWEIK